jgi:hypothetical protein
MDEVIVAHVQAPIRSDQTRNTEHLKLPVVLGPPNHIEAEWRAIAAFT